MRCFSRVGLSVELAVLTVGIPWAVDLAWYWPEKGRADGFTDDPCVQPGLKLPTSLFVCLYNYGDNINISYVLIIANKYIGLILGPNTHLGVFSHVLVKGLLCEIHSHLQQSTEAGALSVSMLKINQGSGIPSNLPNGTN